MRSPSFLHQLVVMPNSKSKVVLMRQNTMPFPHSFLPGARILDLSDPQNPEPIALSLVVLTTEKVTVLPAELPISLINSSNKSSLVFTPTLQRQFSRPAEPPGNKVSRVVRPIFKCKCALPVVESVAELSSVGDLIRRESSLNPLPFGIGAFEAEALAPLLSFALQHTSVELSVEALGVGDDGTEAVG
jgi:hypothetical protein